MTMQQFLGQHTANALKACEHLGSRWHAFSRLYRNVFYRPMVAKEIKLADVEMGSRILHLGCGPLPLTALSLAEAGFQVDAIDRDPRAVESATRVVRANGLQRRIRVIRADGRGIDCQFYDAVWVSFHVSPRRQCLERILSTLKKGGKVVYRNPSGWRTRYYSHVDPQHLGHAELRSTRQAFSKETVMIQKSGQMGGKSYEDTHAVRSMPGEAATG